MHIFEMNDAIPNSERGLMQQYANEMILVSALTSPTLTTVIIRAK